MKKAKIFLTVLTVLAVVGGALAFKAKVPKPFYQCDIPVGLCRINQANLPLNTVPISTLTTGYDELNKQCKFISGKWTCETFVSVE